VEMLQGGQVRDDRQGLHTLKDKRYDKK
jgi:hypothetical protein